MNRDLVSIRKIVSIILFSMNWTNSGGSEWKRWVCIPLNWDNEAFECLRQHKDNAYILIHLI